MFQICFEGFQREYDWLGGYEPYKEDQIGRKACFSVLGSRLTVGWVVILEVKGVYLESALCRASIYVSEADRGMSPFQYNIIKNDVKFEIL